MASHQNLIDARKRYGAIKAAFTQLPLTPPIKKKWEVFDSNITKWVAKNNKALALSKDLVAYDLINIPQLRSQMLQNKEAHNMLLTNVNNLVFFYTPFEGGDNGHTCSLGKWLQHPNTTNQKILALIKTITPVHLKLHEQVKTIKALAASGNVVEAQQRLQHELYPTSKQVFNLLNDITEVIEASYSTFSEMNALLERDSAVYQANALKAIDAIVEKVKEEADKNVKEAEAVASTGRTINIIGIVAGTLIAIMLGTILTLMITRPIAQGVTLAQTMAQGDMTQRLDIEQKDEVGVLAGSLNEMAENLRHLITDVNNGVISLDGASNTLATIADQLAAAAED
ncbi:MAG: chemotaxis protein, partial [Desulfobacterales bacterium]